MKSILFLCVVVAASASNVQLSQSQKEKVQQYSMQCMKKSGVKAEVLGEAKKGSFADDEKLKQFTLCLMKKIGVINADGKVDVDTAISKLPQGVDKVAAKKVLEECKKKTGKDAADTAFEVYKCYYQGTPSHVVF